MSPNFGVGKYDTSACKITVLEDIYASATSFQTDKSYGTCNDILKVGGREYCGNKGPNHRFIKAKRKIVWEPKQKYGQHMAGWRICFTLASDGYAGGHCSGNWLADAKGVERCTCRSGWFGAKCQSQCPVTIPDEGLDYSLHKPLVCGGNGVCDDGVEGTGKCKCDPCFEEDPDSGMCVEKSKSNCGKFGVAVCNAFSGDFQCYRSGDNPGNILVLTVVVD